MDRGGALLQQPNGSLCTWLGFGLFLVTYGGGPFGYISGSVGHATAWESVLVAQVAFFFGAALGCILLAFCIKPALTRQLDILETAAYVAVVLLGLLAQPALDSLDPGVQTIARGVLSVLAGILYAPPLIFWAGRFCHTGTASGHFNQFALLIACYAITPVVLILASQVKIVPYAYSIAMGLCALGCSAIQVFCFRKPPRAEEAPTPIAPAVPYHLTTHSASVLVGFGFSWGISDAASILVLTTSAVPQTISTMLIAAALIVAATAMVLVRRSQGGPKFGMLIRISLVICGAQLVALPLEFATNSMLIYPLCNLTMMVAEMALIIFTIDVCNEEGCPFSATFAVNFATVMLTSCLSSLVFYGTHTLLDTSLAWLASSTVSIWVILVAVLFLPSRSSNAAVLTSETLPENEGYEANIAMRRNSMSCKYHLSESETKVLGCLLQSMKREQIAEELGLSPWTIKARTSAIYRKCGVHSYKELMRLVASDG